MHPPTPPARRVAALRFQAQRLLDDAAAWGCIVEIFSIGGMDGRRTILRVEPIATPHDHEPARAPGAPTASPSPSR